MWNVRFLSRAIPCGITATDHAQADRLIRLGGPSPPASNPVSKQIKCSQDMTRGGRMMADDTEHLLELDADRLRMDGLARTEAGRWAEAIAAWEPYSRLAPDDSEAWGLLTLCYREAGRLDDADRTGSALVDRFSDNWRIVTEWALVPFATRDWPEAARRWAFVRDHFPDNVDALARSASVAEELGDHIGAAGFLEAARHASGDSWWTLVTSARFFERRGAWHGAVPLWRRAAARADAGTEPVENLARCLNGAGKFEIAESTIATYLSRAEPTEALLCEYARAAGGRGEWTLAAARWQAAVDAFPGNADAASHLGDALWHKQVSEGMEAAASAPAERTPAAGGVTPAEDLDPKALSMCFESLGDNCEFGIFQRHHGAEPIGLYRWGAVSASLLIQALEARFEGTGEPENTELSGVPGDEYVLKDRRHWLESHTFVRYNAEQFTKIYDRQTAAMRFLRERLLQDIEEPWKVFVHKPRMGFIEEHEMFALQRALATIGDAPLMCVRVAENSGEIGTVQRLARGLYRGNISRVSPTATKEEIDYAGWLDLCVEAARLAREDGYQVGRS